MGENFPNLIKYINLQIKESQFTPRRLNTMIHTEIDNEIVKDKEF